MDGSQEQFLKNPKINRKMLINGKSLAIVSLAVVIVISTIIMFKSKLSLYDELEIILSIIAAGLFIFLSIGLYNGVNIIGKPIFPKLTKPDFKYFEYFEILPELDTGDGVLGFITAILLWIFITIIAILLLMFIFTVLWSVLLIMIFILYWIFFRALRLVFIKSSLCKGNLGLSLGYSLFYSLLYTVWIFAVVMLSEYFSKQG